MPTNTLDSTLDAISSVTRKFFFPLLADQVNTSNVALMKVRKTNVSGGTDLRQPLRYKRGVQENYSGTETLTVNYVEKKFAAIFPWAQKNFPITISGLDDIKNNGPEKVLDHIRDEMDAAKEDALDSFGTGIYSDGTDSKDIVGARVWLSTSNTYGGISQTANSWWQSNVDSTTTTLSLSAMQTQYEAATEGPDRPDLITMTESIFNDFWALLQPQQRFTDEGTANAGFRNLMFNGAVASEDSYAPSSHMVFWNLKRVKLVSHSQRKFPGVMVDFEMPHDQDVKVGHIRWAGQLICEQPRKQAALTAIT
jgi:hypothetical protein